MAAVFDWAATNHSLPHLAQPKKLTLNSQKNSFVPDPNVYQKSNLSLYSLYYEVCNEFTGPHFPVVASGQHSFFRKSVTAVASCWQHCDRFDQPEIGISSLPCQSCKRADLFKPEPEKNIKSPNPKINLKPKSCLKKNKSQVRSEKFGNVAKLF